MRTPATLFAALALSVAAAAPVVAADMPARTLYDRIGGYDAVAAVTDDFLARLEKDDRLGRFFTGFSTDSKTRIRQHVIDLVCMASGGPCAYVGRDMRTAHAGIGITKEDWARSGELFGQTLEKFAVPEKERAEIGALIAPLEKDIVDGPM